MDHVDLAADGLVSIVFLCCNELASTRTCLESVLKRTRPPFELVLVDNGSVDETAEYLSEVRARTEPARVVVIRNRANAGYAVGCNQALAAAEGRDVVLLDNDTIVSEDWVDRLVAWSRHEWPHVGLVGVVSNCAASPQRIEVSYRDPGGLDALAAARRREFAGRALRVKRLSGFCLLIRRPVLDQVGGFDQAALAWASSRTTTCVFACKGGVGFRLLAALDVFCSTHQGSRTFEGLPASTCTAIA